MSNNKRTHTVMITEVYKKYVEIEAASEEEAIQEAKNQYDSGDIIVDWNHIDDINFKTT